MTKRILSLLLALITVISLLPAAPQTQAATQEDFESIVTKAYDEFAASVYQPKADEKAIDQLLEPALYGNGSTLYFDKNDGMTAALYESALFREAFIKALSTGIASMQDEHKTRLMVRTACTWYDYKNSYSIHHCRDEDYGKEVIDQNLEKTSLPYYNVIASGVALKATPNKCDSAMSLIVGASTVRLLIEQTGLTNETATYHVKIRWFDDFNFDGNYSAADKKGYNTTFVKLLTFMGPLLGLKTFRWYSDTEMTLTVPNTCDHAGGGKYRWEKIGDDLVNVTGDGYLENASVRTTHKTTNSSTGVTTEKYYYTLDRGVELRHDAPWSIEFEIPAANTLYLGPAKNHSYTEQPQFYKSNSRVYAFETIRTQYPNPKTGKLTWYADRHCYGLNFVEAGAPKSGKCVYRIENRIAADGTNSLWLLVNGEELGTLSDYIMVNASENKNYPKGDAPLWTNGKNFTIRYIYNISYAFTKTMPLTWLEIDTAGGYQVTEAAPGSCTEGAGVKTTCILCGLETVESTEAPLGHTAQVIPGKPATCHETGITDGAVCSVCGEVMQAQTEIPVLTHEGKPVPGKAPTCLEAGLTEGSTCGLCGDVLVPQEAVPALGHTEAVIQKGSAPTCTLPGYTDTVACDRCGTLLQGRDEIPVLGHTYENNACIRCGTPDPNAILPGDADENGTLNYNDALLVLRCSIGLNSLPPFTALACDMDGNGKLTYNDALIILRQSIGLK